MCINNRILIVFLLNQSKIFRKPSLIYAFDRIFKANLMNSDRIILKQNFRIKKKSGI